LSIQVEKKRQRQRDHKGKYRIRVRYKYHNYREIDTEDYGSFKQMYEKYKGKMQFWCGDQPPTKEYVEGTYNGYRLDSDISPEHVAGTLKRYGRNKCWIDPTYKVDGKSVCLVFNASFNVGTVGTILGLAVAIKVIDDATHDRWHRDGVHHSHHGRTASGKLKVKKKHGRAHPRPGSIRTIHGKKRPIRRRESSYF
jgi:hypothetical protein